MLIVDHFLQIDLRSQAVALISALASERVSLAPFRMGYRKIIPLSPGPYYGGSGSVSEQDAGTPVLPVRQVGQALASNHQRGLIYPACEISRCRIISKHEPRACCPAQVKAGGVDGAQFLLHLARGTRENHIR